MLKVIRSLMIIAICLHLFSCMKPLRRVDRVIDGDTIVLDGGEKVRLIGIDTPETLHPRKSVQCFGPEASAYLKERVEGKYVRLEYDTEKTDKYNRTLGYIYYDKDFINAEMISNGYAYAYKRFPFRYLDSFVNIEKIARKTKKGLWSRCKTKRND